MCSSDLSTCSRTRARWARVRVVAARWRLADGVGLRGPLWVVVAAEAVLREGRAGRCRLTLAARLAVTSLRPEDLAELEALQGEMLQAARDKAIRSFFDANHRFHLRLVALSGNGRLIETHAQLTERMGRYMARSLSLRGNLERSLQEHREILDALRDRDGLRAAAAVGAHIHVPQLSIELEGESIFDGADDGLRSRELAAD